MSRQPGRILYIAHASPVPAELGPARRNYHVIDQLARFFDVSVLSTGTSSEAKLFDREFGGRVSRFEFVPRKDGRRIHQVWQTLRGRCDFMPALEPNLIRRCAAIASTESFDAIFLSCALLRRLPLPPGTPVVGDTHNVQFHLVRQTSQAASSVLRRAYARRQWMATRREEQRCGRNVDLLLATSDHDREIFEQELQIERVAVVPNGIDLETFAPARGSAEPNTILFTGLMSYYPNQQAMEWFLDSIFPTILQKVPNARLIVAGAAPPRWLIRRRGHHVDVTGRVPDMRPYLQRASVVIVPLLIGSGTRVKILEAQAVGRPVVSTSLGAQGLSLRHGESILLADDAEAFADGVVRLLESPGLAGRLVAGASRHLTAHFDWNRIGEHLASLLQTHVGLLPRQCLRNSS
jgi:glycosyltransferase involved in cell wall biosynthesis